MSRLNPLDIQHGRKVFVILTSPRTGSTYLRLWLNNHSEIRCHGEIFLPKYHHDDGFQNYCSKSLTGRFFHWTYRNKILRRLRANLHPSYLVAGYLNRFLEDPNFASPWIPYQEEGLREKAGEDVLGFKLMYDHLRATPELRRWIDVNKCYILHLLRENNLKRFVSLMRMKRDKLSHSLVSNGVSQPVEIPIDRMMRFFIRSRQSVEFHRDLYAGKNPYLEVSYEALFNDLLANRQKILAFLGVNDEEMLGAPLKRTSTNQIELEITNHAEVVRALAGTEFEGYLSAYSL